MSDTMTAPTRDTPAAILTYWRDATECECDSGIPSGACLHCDMKQALELVVPKRMQAHWASREDHTDVVILGHIDVSEYSVEWARALFAKNPAPQDGKIWDTTICTDHASTFLEQADTPPTNGCDDKPTLRYYEGDLRPQHGDWVRWRSNDERWMVDAADDLENPSTALTEQAWRDDVIFEKRP